jgi:CRP/FNR family transcriptional regulator, cyclic AMP receptor protein
MSTALELIARHPFLDGLGPAEAERLSIWASRAQFRAGSRIFAEGGRADRFWLLLSGHVQLDSVTPRRGRLVIESLGAGAVLGWSWLFPPHEWHLGAVAVEPTHALEFDGLGVRRLCEADPALGYGLTRRFCQVIIDRLQASRVRLLDLYGAP